MKIRLMLCFLALTACQSASQTNRVNQYFDTYTWMEKLVEGLDAEQPELEKTWVYDQKSETKRVSDIDWHREMKLFLDADLNKSSFITSYDSLQLSDGVVYHLKDSENLPIKELSVMWDTKRNLTALRCIRESGNSFFATRSEIHLTAEEGNLVQYEIRSVQKLLWFDPDSSFISAWVVR